MDYPIDHLIEAINIPHPKRTIYSDSENLQKIRISKGADGQYLWCAGLEPNSQSTFMGIPIYYCSEEGLRARFTFNKFITFEFRVDVNHLIL